MSRGQTRFVPGTFPGCPKSNRTKTFMFMCLFLPGLQRQRKRRDPDGQRQQLSSNNNKMMGQHVSITNSQREEQANSNIILCNNNIEVAKFNAATYGSTINIINWSADFGQHDLVNIIVLQQLNIGDGQPRVVIAERGCQTTCLRTTWLKLSQEKGGNATGPCAIINDHRDYGGNL